MVDIFRYCIQVIIFWRGIFRSDFRFFFFFSSIPLESCEQIFVNVFDSCKIFSLLSSSRCPSHAQVLLLFFFLPLDPHCIISLLIIIEFENSYCLSMNDHNQWVVFFSSLLLLAAIKINFQFHFNSNIITNFGKWLLNVHYSILKSLNDCNKKYRVNNSIQWPIHAMKQF